MKLRQTTTLELAITLPRTGFLDKAQNRVVPEINKSEAYRLSMPEVLILQERIGTANGDYIGQGVYDDYTRTVWLNPREDAPNEGIVHIYMVHTPFSDTSSSTTNTFKISSLI